MQNNKIDILVTFDKNYIAPFRVMLTSAVINNPGEKFQVWLLQSSVPSDMLKELEVFCNLQGVTLNPVSVDCRIFADAPVSRQYPQEMYYRLLAPQMLPSSLKRVLYLDPDILVINPLRPLWDQNLEDYAFAAASHGGELINGINRVRLDTEHDYFNSGVMLIDLNKARGLIRRDEVFQCVREHGDELLLPDQDIFNHLYGKQTLRVDDALWNYDARYFSDYLIRSNGDYNMDWVMKNTAVLHFCGKHKPWKQSYSKRFAALYKNYMQIASRYEASISNLVQD